jgi:RHS repeat-associated protein
VAVPQSGRYKVYARWTTHANRATNAPYTVHHAGGETTVRVNQEKNNNVWVLLGSFLFQPGAGHKVVLSDDANEYVIADAVRFIAEFGGETIPRTVAADAVRFVSNDAESPLYVHADHLATPQKMTDQAASLVWDKVQRPFGETFSVSGASTNPKRFPGQLHDPETGFHYNYFRDYDPTTGRYLQSDPIGLDGGLNTYGYVGGNPAYWVDPKGLMKLPGDPTGLPSDWKPDPSHKNPSGGRWRGPGGETLDYHKGSPGKPGWRGKDHWHHNGGKEHLPPGSEIPDPPSNKPNPFLRWLFRPFPYLYMIDPCLISPDAPFCQSELCPPQA